MKKDKDIEEKDGQEKIAKKKDIKKDKKKNSESGLKVKKRSLKMFTVIIVFFQIPTLTK